MLSWLYVVLCTSHNLFWTWGLKRPLVACLVGYAWVSDLCTSSLDRQLCAFNMSTLLTNTSSDEVNLSSTQISPVQLPEPGEIDTLAFRLHLSASRTALFWASCNFLKSLFVASDHITGQ